MLGGVKAYYSTAIFDFFPLNISGQTDQYYKRKKKKKVWKGKV
jgi:hypothetical protein